MATKTKKKETTVEATDKKKKPFLEYEETCCVGFDLAISNGKGLPVGSNILFYALPGSGKSTLICDILYRLLLKYRALGLPYRVHYLDSENSLSLLSNIGKDPKDSSSVGLEEFISIYQNEDDAVYKPQQLIYHPNVSTFEQAEEVYDQCINHRDVEFNKDIKVIVTDSLTNLTSKTLMEAEVSKADFGSDAKERNRFYKKWLGKARHCGITGIFTSQVRTKQGATMYEDPNRPAVTEGDKHNMDIIAKLTKITNSNRAELKKVKQKTIDGDIEWQDRYILKISTFGDPRKNREDRLPDVELLLQHGRRVVNSYTVYNMLVAHGYIVLQNKKVGHFTQGFIDLMGDKDLTVEDGSVIPMRAYIVENMKKVKELLKTNGQYTAIVGEMEESDDGFN